MMIKTGNVDERTTILPVFYVYRMSSIK